MKSVFKLLNIVIAGVLVFIAIAVTYIALPFFDNQALIVRSGSMIPTIDVGSVAVVRKTLNDSYSKGDVIAFRSEKNRETITTHRIVEAVMEEDAVLYRTQGDANNAPDAVLVKQENVLGKTYIVVPYVGKVLGFAKSDIGFPALIIFPALFVILIEAWSIFKEIRKRRRLHTNFGFVNHDLRRPYRKSLISLKLIVPILAFSLLIPSTFAFFSDSEVSTGNIFQAAESFCTEGQVFQIGDTEASQLDNPVDELNWPGVFGNFPAFADPFVINTNTNTEFPWNSNFNQNYATDFDVNFAMPHTAVTKLTISWSPGKSGTEHKDIKLDNVSIGSTPTRVGVDAPGWWENMQRFEDPIEDIEISSGNHTFTFLHPEGDGTLWDYVRLEITSCDVEE